jgi:TatD DNase family protein
VHPNAAGAASADDLQAIAQLARAARVVAIGETGLDYYRDNTPPRRQRDALAWHIRLAEELDLPLIIHNRLADADVADALEASAPRVRGVLHCFSSDDAGYLDRMLAAHYWVSFAGPLTFKSSGSLPDMARRVPLDRLLVETDCPYLAPVPRRGRRNEPAFVRFTAEHLAGLRGLSLAELAEQLWVNTSRAFPSLAPDEVQAVG